MGPSSDVTLYLGDAARACGALAVLIVAATIVRRHRPDATAPLLFGVALAGVNLAAPILLRWLGDAWLADDGAGSSHRIQLLIAGLGLLDAATYACGAWALVELAQPPPWARARPAAPPGPPYPPPS